jgi:tetratricopeptide (TPR) repeat protein
MKVLLFLGLAFQAVSPEVAQHVRAGVEARQAGHLDQAITEFRKVTELAPDLAAGFVNLGAVYMESHDYSAAIAPLKRALELNPELVGAHQMLGYSLLARGYAAEAIPHLERAQVQEALGIAQLETGKLPEAIANLTAALSKRPNDPDILFYVGRASGLLSKQSFDELLAGYPDSARAHLALGEAYSAGRQVPEAEKEYREALRLQPDTPGVRLALGDLYATASQWDKAVEVLRTETEMRPGDGEAAYRFGNALLELGKIHEARRELERADHIKPDMPETLYALGKAASLDGDAVLAAKSWMRLLAIEKNGPLAAQAHYGLAALFRKQGKTAEAEREMREFQNLKESAPTGRQNQL